MEPTKGDKLLKGKENEHQLKSTDHPKENSKVLALIKKPSAVNPQPSTRVLYSVHTTKSSIMKHIKTRHIPTRAHMVLDAPALKDDFYLNLLDWSCLDVISLALGSKIFLYRYSSRSLIGEINCLNQMEYVASVSWIDDGSHLAIGTSTNEVFIWDIESNKRVRRLKGHDKRVGVLCWNSYILSSGNSDGVIINYDVRLPDPIVNRVHFHEQEVCGLKWSPDGKYLSSGGNDNIVNIIDSTNFETPLHTIPHEGAVRAIAWCPWQKNILVSGGGSTDRRLRFWNSQTGNCIASVDTQSQVCSILWSKLSKELISSHGFVKNHLAIWEYPSTKLVGELTGHSARVLHLALSPDGTTVASAASDETLRFWKVFAAKSSHEKASTSITHLR